MNYNMCLTNLTFRLSPPKKQHCLQLPAISWAFNHLFEGRRQSTWWAIKQWWQETTDSVILNSPWLRHGIDRVLRCLWVLVQLPFWYDVLYLEGERAFAYEFLIRNPVNCTLAAIKALVSVFSSQFYYPLTRKKRRV